jgi:nucleoside-diphosphate-sugar epimerase
MCSEKAMRLLGWRPKTTLEQGLHDYRELIAGDRRSGAS